MVAICYADLAGPRTKNGPARFKQRELNTPGDLYTGFSGGFRMEPDLDRNLLLRAGTNPAPS